MKHSITAVIGTAAGGPIRPTGRTSSVRWTISWAGG